MRLVTPVEVSLWTTQTALIRCSRSAAQLLGDLRRIDAVPPVAGHELDIEPEPARHLPPQRREMPGLEHQHPVARRQRVDQRRLPRPGAGRGIDHDGAGGLEDPLHAGHDLLAERRRIPGRDGRSSGTRSRAARGRARWSVPGSAGNGGRYGRSAGSSSARAPTQTGAVWSGTAPPTSEVRSVAGGPGYSPLPASLDCAVRAISRIMALICSGALWWIMCPVGASVRSVLRGTAWYSRAEWRSKLMTRSPGPATIAVGIRNSRYLPARAAAPGISSATSAAADRRVPRAEDQLARNPFREGMRHRRRREQPFVDQRLRQPAEPGRDRIAQNVADDRHRRPEQQRHIKAKRRE